MPTVYVNIGSNIGNRRSVLERAVACIKGRWCNVRVSGVVESEPWGYDSPNSFLNVGVAFECDSESSPLDVHRELQYIQNSICGDSHRTDGGVYVDRVIDIDLIAIDSEIVDSKELQLPHPRMHMREFVLVPMMELASGWVHPVFGLTCAKMLAKVSKSSVSVSYDSILMD
ncbi:MAG: 2-amino-4-hydroxy-6-hydroxymethyldihydropteridine diphosphokinase [Paramuribaculum sp.]|nr:2-amino-4-hydroxy-6-hydroxymethyldihydropteridine diphosphokinase [Paramuribaculum sp.]